MKILFLLTMLSLPHLAHAKLKIITTTTTLAVLAREIGGNHVTVNSLTKATQDPHYVEAKPSYMVQMRSADLLVAVGLDLEIGWLGNIQRGSRNPKLLNKSLGFFEAGDYIEALEIPEGKIDRSEGDIHPLGNPHFHLDPERTLLLAKALASRFGQIDPANKAFYQNNAQSFSKKLLPKIKSWKKRLQTAGIKKVITYHKSFNYFLHYFNIQSAATIEPKPGIPPTAKHIIYLINLIKTHKIKCILNESYFETTPGKRLQKITRAHLEVINIEANQDYLQLIENMVIAIENCAKGYQ